jgi:hypothetical protein
VSERCRQTWTSPSFFSHLPQNLVSEAVSRGFCHTPPVTPGPENVSRRHRHRCQAVGWKWLLQRPQTTQRSGQICLLVSDPLASSTSLSFGSSPSQGTNLTLVSCTVDISVHGAISLNSYNVTLVIISGEAHFYFYFAVLGPELRAYTLSHSTSPF